MPPRLALETNVEVFQRGPVVVQCCAGFPGKDPLFHRVRDVGEIGAHGLVEQDVAIGSAAPNPPGYELFSADGVEGGGCFHSSFRG